MGLPKLYEIAQDYARLGELAEHEDLPPEVIRDTLEGLEGDLSVKATNVAKFVLGIEAEADAILEAAEQIRQRGERRRKRAESIRHYLLFCMQGAGITKIECPEFTLAVQKNPDAVEIENPEAIPAEFLVTPEPPPPRPDKALIKAALKAGRRVEGAWLRQGEHLRIRT
jgi:Siphovirus Gp157